MSTTNQINIRDYDGMIELKGYVCSREFLNGMLQDLGVDVLNLIGNDKFYDIEVQGKGEYSQYMYKMEFDTVNKRINVTRNQI